MSNCSANKITRVVILSIWCFYLTFNRLLMCQAFLNICAVSGRKIKAFVLVLRALDPVSHKKSYEIDDNCRSAIVIK